MDDYYCKIGNRDDNIVRLNPHCTSLFCQDAKRIFRGNGKDAKSSLLYQKSKDIPIYEDFGLPPITVDDVRPNDEFFLTTEDIYKVYNGEKYKVRGQRPSTQIHVGQLKLFLSTMQFLNKYTKAGERVHVVYPGSAPGQNIILMADLFPNTLWYLCDPRPLCKEVIMHSNVKYTYEGMFLEENIRDIKSLIPPDEKVLLISDIRIVTSNNDTSIDRDMKLQMEWVKLLNPDHSQLKFRLPRIGMDDYPYLNGKLYIQYFACMSSTELRLVTSKEDNLEMVDYNVGLVDDIMFLFNGKLRVRFYNTPSLYREHGFDSCHDCYGASLIIKEYCEKYGKSESEIIKLAMRIPTVRWQFNRETSNIKYKDKNGRFVGKKVKF